MAVILGINACFSANHHDPSAALVINGKTVAAIEEERLNRIKTSIGLFPTKAVEFCLKHAGINIKQVNIIAAPGITSKDLITKISATLVHEFGFSPKIVLLPHYLCHAAGAFFSSGFKESLVVSMDGYGDSVSTWIGYGKGRHLHEIEKLPATKSVGEFYVTFTERLGFIRTEGEFKLMGMAACGKPKFDLSKYLKITNNQITTKKAIEKRHKITSTFEPCVDHQMLDRQKLPKRDARETTFHQCHFDLAASVQKQFEKVYVHLIKKYTNSYQNICISGGCALNCLANLKIQNIFKDVYVMPAASDRGLSLGAALLLSSRQKQPSPIPSMFLGPRYSQSQVTRQLKKFGIPFRLVKNPAMVAARQIALGKIIGWHNGRSEFGPRALGARSILANPSFRGMKNKINAMVKFREPYRPFAPAILETVLPNYGITKKFPFMTVAIKPNKKLTKRIKEAVHFDGTTRIQSVPEKGHPLAQVLKSLQKIGKFPAVINTSFNLSGEPIVESPLDAVRTFYSCGLDSLFLGSVYLSKDKN